MTSGFNGCCSTPEAHQPGQVTFIVPISQVQVEAQWLAQDGTASEAGLLQVSRLIQSYCFQNPRQYILGNAEGIKE